MPSGPKFSVLALVAVALVGWGLVALSPEARPPAASAPPALPDPEPRPAPPAAKPSEEPAPRPAPGPAAASPPAHPAPRPTPRPAATLPGTAEDPERPDFGDEPQEDPVAKAYEEHLADREAQRARYDSASARFVDEVRDPEWAEAKELEMQEIIDSSDIGDLIEGMECRATLCKVELRFSGLTAPGAVVRLGPLTHRFGPDRAVRNEGPPDNRIMVVYTSREGHELDAE